MRCHYCGHEEPIPHRCPNCGGNKIRYYGTGTQKVEEELQELYPHARILRMDVDTTRKKEHTNEFCKNLDRRKQTFCWERR